jgi:ribosomal protein S12 methylthiotransferase accessory factor
MEAIELAAAEPSSDVTCLRTTYRELAAYNGHSPAELVDLCPLANMRIPLDEQLTAVRGKTWSGGEDRLFPTELVLLPPPPGAAEQAVFGASSVGLGCGFTHEAAIRHALLEVVERDVLSYYQFDATAVDVDLTDLDERLAALAAPVMAAGLDLRVAVLPNHLGIPTAHVTLVDPEEDSPSFLNGGFATETAVERAIERALLEAVQSRVCFMHGGREDLPDLVVSRTKPQPAEPDGRMRLHDIRALFKEQRQLASLDDLVRTIESADLGPVGYVTLRDGESDGIWVVRVIVPGCEAFAGKHLPRIGPRLSRFVRG